MVLSDELWKRSGHYDHFRENMYFLEVDERSYAVKPMNCPGACLVYGSPRSSYRELPLRLAEFGRVHRHELSGVLHGLIRVRTFTQDDAHVYCAPDQIEAEIADMIDMPEVVYRALGFGVPARRELATRPAQRHGGASQLGAGGGGPRAGARPRRGFRRGRLAPGRAPSTARRSSST